MANYNRLTTLLREGGADKSFSLATGPDQSGHNPTDDLRPFHLPYDFIVQGQHKTAGGYVDTLNFILADSKSSLPQTTMRAFSMSGIHGAYGDGGQNFKSIAYLATQAWSVSSSEMQVLYGCGGGH